MEQENDIPFWIKISYTLVAVLVFVVYIYEYGVVNFLWFSDIAFFVMVPALWFQNRFLSSMMAIGILPIEALWTISLFSGGSFLGIANYMYDPALPLWLRLLSLFHFLMIASIIYMIVRFGYDRRALIPQIILGLFVILLTHKFSSRVENINMIFPPEDIAPFISEGTYFILMPAVLVILVIIPAHFLLKRFFPIKS